MGASINGILHLITAQAYVKFSCGSVFLILLRKLEHIPENNLFKTREGTAVKFLGH